MPNRRTVYGETYRYAYQGQEKDTETGKEAFQLRLWDARIGRWLTTDPMGEFSSPYLGMGNNPLNKIDPDGGHTDDWIKDLVSGSLIWVNSSGNEALKEAAVKFGHRSLMSVDNNEGLDKVELVSMNYFTNGSDLSFENLQYLDIIKKQQGEYLSDVSERLSINTESLINAINGKIPKFDNPYGDKKSLIDFVGDFSKDEIKGYAIEKLLPKAISNTYSFLTSSYMSTTSLGKGYKNQDLTPRVLDEMKRDLLIISETKSLIKNRAQLTLIKMHQF